MWRRKSVREGCTRKLRSWCQWHPQGQGMLSLAGHEGQGQAGQAAWELITLLVFMFPSWADPCAVRTASIPTGAGPKLWPVRRKLSSGGVVMKPRADECVWVWLHSPAQTDWRWKHALLSIQGCREVLDLGLTAGGSVVHEFGERPSAAWVTAWQRVMQGCSAGGTTRCHPLGRDGESPQSMCVQNMQLLTWTVLFG